MNANGSERIFTKEFFLIFAALLFTALVMCALMSVTEYATTMGSTKSKFILKGIVSKNEDCEKLYF
ncbi:MAG: hypothetical protein IJ672_06590 [Methanobrevibacter sp.]|uniref:hypothetical protein n=1 Tax=Methanobrevibacter sp. TaxID=66852 RepID=UPI0025DDD269|nr:hypothetical protein [Methanobrevibacter sp.]MBQ8018500.1 hypothetical protein [Methanobrevibacter sp.]MBR1611131.1 hypothetical protein [Methanobrevibacter sp.]